MSRTIRRHNAHSKSWYLGTREEYLTDPWYHREAVRAGMTVEKAWDQRQAAYHRCSKRGKWAVPKFYRQQHGILLMRRIERLKLHHHLRNDTWELHLPESRMRNMMYQHWF